jgi:hypothetical protein
MSKLAQAQIQRYAPLPIEGLKNPIALVWSPPLGLTDLCSPDYFLQYYNREDAKLLPLRDIVTVANAVQSRKPSEQFIDYARKNSRLTEETIISGYKHLHEKIWEGFPSPNYRMRAREILVLADPRRDLCSMIIGYNPPYKPHPYLIRDCNKIVADREKKMFVEEKVSYRVDVSGIEPPPIIPVNWSIEGGTIAPELAKLLGAPQDSWIMTDSWIIPDSTILQISNYCAELRALEILLSLTDDSKPNRPTLSSNSLPWDVRANTGLLLEVKS